MNYERQVAEGKEAVAAAYRRADEEVDFDTVAFLAAPESFRCERSSIAWQAALLGGG